MLELSITFSRSSGKPDAPSQNAHLLEHSKRLPGIGLRLLPHTPKAGDRGQNYADGSRGARTPLRRGMGALRVYLSA
ncbi:MAG: hypothetical protein H7095_08490 [Pseudopedobacter sp.]|nr:hypothetical protein [Deinococcales bacterium]